MKWGSRRGGGKKSQNKGLGLFPQGEREGIERKRPWYQGTYSPREKVSTSVFGKMIKVRCLDRRKVKVKRRLLDLRKPKGTELKKGGAFS